MKQRAARRADALSRTPAASALEPVLVDVKRRRLLEAPRSARAGAPP